MPNLSLDIECKYDESRMKPSIKPGVIESLSRRIDTLEQMFLGQSRIMHHFILLATHQANFDHVSQADLMNSSKQSDPSSKSAVSTLRPELSEVFEPPRRISLNQTVLSTVSIDVQQKRKNSQSFLSPAKRRDQVKFESAAEAHVNANSRISTTDNPSVTWSTSSFIKPIPSLSSSIVLVTVFFY